MPLSQQSESARPMRADARRNHERILDAAREAFAEYGVDVQMDEIARRAGVGVGTLYRNFPTKDELLGALAAAHVMRVVELTDAALAAPGSPFERLKACVMSSARLMEADVAMSQLLWRSVRATERASAQHDLLLERTGELVAEGVAAGELRADAVATDVATLMCGLGSVMAAAASDPRLAWERHLTLGLDGLRFDAARSASIDVDARRTT